ncbi:MAG: CoB--CoM heterodisulfide reductase iron-sulfur subunit A [Candidatus Heimdallarchaeota archaeon LC_3]|nr:MAG: CoB--CoM heterodisulfide reductase iron-sulfur subunit A [Candidatus Heimdallarchaeota archaeon LC_3]
MTEENQDKSGEVRKTEPKIGVFICACGKNIGKVVDVEAVKDYTEGLDNVVYVETNKYTCSEVGQRKIEEAVKKHGLDRFVVSACSPRLHGETFSRCATKCGVNGYMTEMANIREHCSWVHSKEPEKATEKAKELVEMQVAKIRHNEPLDVVIVPVEKTALVIGGGIGGIQSALDMADAGFKVVIVEKDATIGGQMARLDKTFPTIDCSICILGPKMNDVKNHPNIELIATAEVSMVSGFTGNFDIEITQHPRYVTKDCTGCSDCEEVCPVQVPNHEDQNLGWRKAIYMPFPQAVPPWYILDEKNCLGLNPIACGKCLEACEKVAIDYHDHARIRRLKAGTIIIATGATIFDASKISEYGWGRYPNVLQTMELDRMLNASGPTDGEVVRPTTLEVPKSVAFILCAGSRHIKYNDYCSNFCCMATLKYALMLKDHYPEIDISVFYIDIRAFGKNYEEFYKRARATGTKFIRARPSAVFEDKNTKNLRVEAVTDGQPISPEFEMVVLSVGFDGPKTVIPGLPISTDANGFFVEAHPKLKPVDTATDGVFLVGACDSPKDIRETVTQASAAASRAMRLMGKGEYEVEPIFANVNPETCTSCGICVTRCPYTAITIEDKKAKTPAIVNTALCKGCGTCAGDCPENSITMQHFTDEMIYDQISVALNKNPEEKVISYCCNWCSYAGSDTAGVGRNYYPTNVRIIRTMCSGRVAPDFIYKAFEQGAGGVLLTGCHPADCHYMTGNDFAAKREKKIRNWMKKRGINQSRFQIEWISATEGKKFSGVMQQMTDTIGRVPITRPVEPPPKSFKKKATPEQIATGD